MIQLRLHGKAPHSTPTTVRTRGLGEPERCYHASLDLSVSSYIGTGRNGFHGRKPNGIISARRLERRRLSYRGTARPGMHDVVNMISPVPLSRLCLAAQTQGGLPSSDDGSMVLCTCTKCHQTSVEALDF